MTAFERRPTNHFDGAGSDPAPIPKPSQIDGTPQQPWKELAGSNVVYHLTIDNIATALVELLDGLRREPVKEKGD